MVTSFFPGRVRLRASIFKDSYLVNKAVNILKGFPAVKNIQTNLITGSVLLEYDPNRVPIEKLSSLQDFFTKLAKEASNYSQKNYSVIEKMLDEFEYKLKGISKNFSF